jgi:hypothetical protein
VGQRIYKERDAGEHEKYGGKKLRGTAQRQGTPVAAALGSGREAVQRIDKFEEPLREAGYFFAVEEGAGLHKWGLWRLESISCRVARNNWIKLGRFSCFEALYFERGF